MHRGLPRKRVRTHRPYLCASTRLYTGSTHVTSQYHPPPTLTLYPYHCFAFEHVRFPLFALRPPFLIHPNTPPFSTTPLALPPTLYCSHAASRSQSSGSGGGGPLEEKDGNDGGDAKVGSKKKSVDKKKKKAAEKKKKSLRRL
jgi:hypothetical protein